jgi:hypothetical protein
MPTLTLTERLYALEAAQWDKRRTGPGRSVGIAHTLRVALTLTPGRSPIQGLAWALFEDNTWLPDRLDTVAAVVPTLTPDELASLLAHEDTPATSQGPAIRAALIMNLASLPSPGARTP